LFDAFILVVIILNCVTLAATNPVVLQDSTKTNDFLVGGQYMQWRLWLMFTDSDIRTLLHEVCCSCCCLTGGCFDVTAFSTLSPPSTLPMLCAVAANQDSLEVAYVVIFTFEAAVKMLAWGFYWCGPKSYFRDTWNKLDFFIVLMGWAIARQRDSIGSLPIVGRVAPKAACNDRFSAFLTPILAPTCQHFPSCPQTAFVRSYVEIFAALTGNSSVNVKPLRAFRVLRPLKLVTLLTSRGRLLQYAQDATKKRWTLTFCAPVLLPPPNYRRW